jgi:4-amino-4-deoxy-L-arabinose transferase-like glycosyltransferase
MAAHPVPRWVWAFPAATALAALLAWTVWCNTERGTWLGGILILVSGLFVVAFAHESLPHHRGLKGALARWAVAILAGAAFTGVVFLAAGLGYYLRCPPF